SGKVLFDGNDLTAMHGNALRKMRQRVQLIFQDPIASLNPRRRIGDIVAEPLIIAGIKDPEKRTQMVSDVLSAVGLDPALVIGRLPHEFSGGQCQRIGIARAMILRPKLIVCDEPVSALDVSIQAQIINLLRKLQAELGLSLLFISHNLSVVRHISHRVMVLYLGRIMEIAERDAFYANPMHPYSKALISAIPLPDPKAERARERVMLQGDLPSPLNPPTGCRFCTRCPMATDLCHTSEPPLAPRADGRLVACHFV
ncbi:MAG TPA: oligopeptide/dipeptide ABC transporter ATP-binding protein, partial [Dongiaceae bacterium]